MNAFLLHLRLPRLVGDGWENGGAERGKKCIDAKPIRK